MRKNRRSMKEALLKRVQEGQNRKEGTAKGIFKTDLEDVPFWNCADGDHLLDIIPYMAGPYDPVTPEGKETYVLEVFVHRGVGITEGSIICLAETYRKPCPICEDRKKKQIEGEDDDIIRVLRPSRFPRSIYNIVCYDSVKEEDKGVQVWHTSNFLMEQYLLELAKSPVRPGQKGIEPFIAFADPDEGKSIAFTRTGTMEQTKFIGIRFVSRENQDGSVYVISDEMLNAAHCLDKLIYIPSYEEVHMFYYGESSESEEFAKDRRPEGRKTIETRTETSIRRERREEPARREETEDKEDKNTCPVAGGKFGEDVDGFQDCEECDKWSECAREKEKLESEEGTRATGRIGGRRRG